MPDGITVLNIREYLSAAGDKELVFSDEDALLIGYFTIAIKPISVKAEQFSNTVKRKLARVSELDKTSGTYHLSAYLIAQLGKNFKDGLDKRITGEQLLQAAVNTIKVLQYMAGGMVVFLETENVENLLQFYEQKNGFKKFDTRKTKSEHPHPPIHPRKQPREAFLILFQAGEIVIGVTLRIGDRKVDFMQSVLQLPWRA